MSVTAAHAFIRATADDARVRARVEALGQEAALAELVALGAEAGFDFDAKALRTAWRQDWLLRWLAASANGSATGNRAASTLASPE